MTTEAKTKEMTANQEGKKEMTGNAGQPTPPPPPAKEGEKKPEGKDEKAADDSDELRKLEAENKAMRLELLRRDNADLKARSGSPPFSTTADPKQGKQLIRAFLDCFINGAIRKRGWEGEATPEEVAEYCDRTFEGPYAFGGERHKDARDAQKSFTRRAVRLDAKRKPIDDKGNPLVSLGDGRLAIYAA